ncbi:MAG TPA: DUF5666 domain-containing protein [Candidatus Limnocylindrales bacterium]|nr:DUF5666 domain-containing protein [Candidatus Limnocylindrales bacterium]
MDERAPNSYSAGGRLGRSRGPAALVAFAAAGLLLIGAAGFAFGASPAASSSTGADASNAPVSPAPAASKGPKDRPGGRLGLGPAGLLRDLVGPRHGFGDIHVTAIDGSNLSLATDDGWTRTITVGSDTKLTRAGAAITLADLKVGDQVRFAESKAADGSWSITRLQVVLPNVVGEVTAKTSDSLTVKRLDGTTTTVHVSATTAYRTAGKPDASLADVNVGSAVVAVGNARDDGSLDAIQVLSGQPKAIEGRGRGLGGPHMPKGPKDRNARPVSPVPSAGSSATPG